jgi:DNA-binding phage protein
MIIMAPKLEELQRFYQDNQELFRLPELRSFSYIKVSRQFMQAKINITDEELTNFYHENKDEFVDKTFNQVKKQVTEMLTQQKLEELNLEFMKNLEDNVASGSNLTEIAEKYELQLESINDVSYDSIITDKTGLADAADTIFELVEGELSYPIELQDKTGLLLIELKSIKPSKIEDFEVNQDRVAKLWRDQQISLLNLQIIENLAKEYAPGKTNSKELASMGIKINSNFSLTRAELKDNEKLPAELLIAIFQTKPGANTQIFKFGNSAYFAYVKSIKIDKTKAWSIRKSAGEDIATTIKHSVIDELIAYFIHKNEMKINNKSSVFSAQ